MKALTNAIKMLEGKGAKAPEKETEQRLDEVRDLGFNLLELAYKSKTTKDDLFNQHDAYAFAIFSNGRLVEMHFLEPEMSEGPSKPWKKGGLPEGITGRQASREFIENYTPPSDGTTLLITNGMFYSFIQDVHQSYKILSQIEDEIEDYRRNWNGTIQTIGL